MLFPEVGFHVVKGVDFEAGVIPNNLCLEDDPNFAALESSPFRESRRYSTIRSIQPYVW